MFFFSSIGCEAENEKNSEKLQYKTDPGPSVVFDTTKVMSIENQLEFLPDNSFPYLLDLPDTTFKLPNKLREISGLGIDEKGEYLCAVQDEEGELFFINIATGEVEKEVRFHKDGDYEGVEIAAGRVFIIKSTGTLYEVTNIGEEKQELLKYKFDLNKNSDVEGLGYDPLENRLLISCKGKVGKGEEFKKGIFGVNLETMKLDEKPAYTISVEAVKSFLDINKSLEKLDKLVKLFQPGEEFIFGPSGLAVHPVSGDIYIPSSVGKLMIVLDRKGKIKHMVKLKKKIHVQPEGIVFDEKGNMYLANEGKEGKGRIHKFVYRGKSK